MKSKHQPDSIVDLYPDSVEFEAQIAAVKSKVDLLGICIRIANANGYRYFSVLKLPRTQGSELAAISLIANWPRRLIEEYDNLNLLQNSPLIVHLNSSAEPLIFDIQAMNRKRADGRCPQANEIFLRYGFRVGMCFSAHLPDGTIGAVTFVGDKHSPKKSQVMELHYLSTMLFAKAVEICEGQDEIQHSITRLELECLRWVSEGKSIEDLSELAGISKHTANLVLKSAKKKLKATTNAHAVVKAMRKSLIA